MSCACNDHYVSTRSSFCTNGAAVGSKLFIAVTDAFETAEIAIARLDVEVTAATSALRLIPAIRYSNDGSSWGTPIELGTAISGTGTTYGSWSSLGATPRLLQAGFLIYNNSGSANEFGSAIATVGLKSGGYVPAA